MQLKDTQRDDRIDAPSCGDGDHPPHRHRLHGATELRRAARMCAAMGDPERLRLLELLFQGPHCVSELTAETGDSMSLVSQRLKVLSGARLLERERRGKHVYYALADDHVRQFIRSLLEHSQEHHPEP